MRSREQQNIEPEAKGKVPRPLPLGAKGRGTCIRIRVFEA